MCYILKLADGGSWRITAFPEAQAWLEKFAAITAIRQFPGENIPRIIVIRGPRSADVMELLCATHADGEVFRTLPDDGWIKGSFRYSTYVLHPKTHDIIYNIITGTDETAEFAAMRDLLKILYYQVQQHGGIPFHAALIEHSGRGIILCARGSTGKSTCCRRVPQPWRALCDDETLVVRTAPQQYAAHPFPTWSEYMNGNTEAVRDVKQSVPLAAVVFLEQAGKDELLPFRKAQAVVLMNQFAYLSNLLLVRQLGRNDRLAFASLIFDNVANLARYVPAYILKVSLTGRFWEELEKIEAFA